MAGEQWASVRGDPCHFQLAAERRSTSGTTFARAGDSLEFLLELGVVLLEFVQRRHGRLEFVLLTSTTVRACRARAEKAAA